MSRTMLVLSVASLLLAGCASTRTPGVIDASPHVNAVSEPIAAAPATIELTVPAAETTEPEPATPVIDPSLGLWSADAGALHESRFTLKGGLFSSTEDELDDGFIFNASWMRFFSRIFALEFEAGYVDVDGDDGGVDAEVWAVPLMVNGRFNLPVWIIDLYAGLGVGGFYYDAEASGAVSDDDNGFLLGGNGFLGGTINVAEAVALGLEFKYYVTDEIDDVDVALDAYALMLTLGWSR